MYGIQDKINQILRGAQTIKKNSMESTAATQTNEVARLRELLEKAIAYLRQSYRDGFADEINEIEYDLNQLTK